MIDTTTTAGKIEVMQAYEDGKHIEKKLLHEGWVSVISSRPDWEWSKNNYRIKPQTVEDAAEAFRKDYCIGKWLDDRADRAVITIFKNGAKWQKGQAND